MLTIPELLIILNEHNNTASSSPEVFPTATEIPKTEVSNPPETIESLRKYEKSPEQAQKFLGKAEIFRTSNMAVL